MIENTTLEELKSLIEKAQSEKAIRDLLELSKNRKSEFKIDSQTSEEILLLSSRFNRVSNENRKGTIRNSEFQLELNKINSDLVQIIKKLENLRIESNEINPEVIEPKENQWIYSASIVIFAIGIIFFVLKNQSHQGSDEYNLNNNVVFDGKVKSYKWSEGWTNIEFFEIGGKTYMLRSKAKGTGDSGKNVHIEKINSNGSIGNRVTSYEWSEGWTNIEFFETGNKTYILRGKTIGTDESGKNIHIEKINSDGSIGDRIKSYKWSEGWTNIDFFETGGKTYMLRSKAKGTGDSGKNVHIEKINSNGSIGSRVTSYKWSEGWTNIEFFETNGKTYMLRSKTKGTGDSGKNIHIEKIDLDGSIGSRVKSYEWSEGWTNIEFFETSGKTFMLRGKTKGKSDSGKNVHIEKINSDGSIGELFKSFNWSEGWDSFEFYSSKNKNYMLQAKSRGKGTSGFNIHIRRIVN